MGRVIFRNGLLTFHIAITIYSVTNLYFEWRPWLMSRRFPYATIFEQIIDLIHRYSQTLNNIIKYTENCIERGEKSKVFLHVGNANQVSIGFPTWKSKWAQN